MSSGRKRNKVIEIVDKKGYVSMSVNEGDEATNESFVRGNICLTEFVSSVSK